jgi:hypothetical protein
MKTWVKVVLGIVATIVVALTLVFYFTAGMVDAADGFFTAVKAKDMVKARTYLAEDFKKSTDENALTQFLSNSALLNFKEASWAERQVNDDGRGELNGSITTETGGTVPIKMTFVKENEEWKIYAIQKPAAGLQTETSSAPATTPTIVANSSAVPDKVQQIAMVKQAMHDFLISITQKDMGHFRSTTANLWQQQFTTEKLNEVFKSIIDTDANWSLVENVEPVLTTADVKPDEDGVITLSGYYPTTPSQVQFDAKYIYEDTAWKLIGFYFHTKPADNADSANNSQTVPDKNQQLTMAKQAMHDFLISVNQKDMGHFRSTTSALWQQQFTTQKFNEVFKAIINLNANWSNVEKVEPILTSPEVKPDQNGVITITGYYPTKPNQVYFKDDFLYEAGAWKLVGFDFEAK